MSKSDAHSACVPLCARGSHRPHRREGQELKGPAQAQTPQPGICGSRSGVSSPVQVEGSDLRIVPLVVREIKKVRGCLLLSRLPRKKRTKHKELTLRKPSGGRAHAAHTGPTGALRPGLPTLTPSSLRPSQDCQKPPGDFSPALLPPPCSSGVTNPFSSLAHFYTLPVLCPAPPQPCLSPQVPS